jgi:hypothetical protein
VATHGLPIWPWTQSEADELPPPERLLLDVLRSGMMAAAKGHPVLPALRLVLVTEDAVAAAPALDMVLRLAQRHVSPAPPFHSGLTDDEAALLLAFALGQRAPRREALAALLRLMPAPEATAALPALLQAGSCLRRAGLLLRNPLR